MRGVRRLELAPFTADELAEQVEGILGERPTRGSRRAAVRALGGKRVLHRGAARRRRGDGAAGVASRPVARANRAPVRAGAPVARARGDRRACRRRAPARGGWHGPRCRVRAGAARGADPAGAGGTWRRGVLCVSPRARQRGRVSATCWRASVRRCTSRWRGPRRNIPSWPQAPSGCLGELAHHWYSAGDLVRALQTSVQAGADSERAFAFAETQRHCERALSIWYRVPDAEVVAGIDRVALLERTALAAIRAEQPHRGAELAAEAVAEFDADDDPVRLAQVYVVLGRCRWLSADTDGSLAAYGEAVRLVPEQPASSGTRTGPGNRSAGADAHRPVCGVASRCAEALAARGAAGRTSRAGPRAQHARWAGVDGGRPGRARRHGAPAVIRGRSRGGDRPVLCQRQRGL